MTDKKDGAGKAQERSAAEASSAKRPFATIDLKATDVSSKPGSNDPSVTQSSQGDSADKIVAAGRDLRSQRAAGSGPSPDLRPAEPAASPASEASRRDAASPMRGAPGGLSRILTHVAAGLAGGLIVLLAAHFLAPRMGLDGKPQSPVVSGITPDYGARLDVLEAQVRERLTQAQPAPSPRLAVLEQGLAKLEDVQRQIATMGEAQSRLLGETATLREALAKAQSLHEAGDRLAKLEEQLSAMSAAAAADPQRAGRLPQLAQLTGQIADLKASIDNRLAAHRKDVLVEAERMAAQSLEAAETAKAGALRLDKEVTALRSESLRLSERIEQMKNAADRLEQSLKGTQSETVELKAALDGFRGDVSGQFRATAKPADVAMAVAPLADRVQKLEASVENVVKAEADRKSNAERIVLSLELGNLKRAMERGQRYSAELAEVRKVAGDRINLAALERFQNEGVPTVAELQRAFRPLAAAIIDADAQPPDGGVVDRLLSGAKTIVRVRKTTVDPSDTSAEAVVARMEAALKDLRLADVVSEAGKLSAKAAAPAQDWLRRIEARRSVDAALAEIDAQLKSSLGAAPVPAKGARP